MPSSLACRTLWKSYLLSCRTKLAKLLCLKCFGRICFVNFSFCHGRQGGVLSSRLGVSYLEDYEAVALIAPSDHALVLRAFQHSTANWSVCRPERTVGCDLLTCTACAPTTKSAWYTRGPHNVDSALTKSLELFAPIPAGPSIVDGRQWAQWQFRAIVLPSQTSAPSRSYTGSGQWS